jgi:hypothetical protein
MSKALTTAAVLGAGALVVRRVRGSRQDYPGAPGSRSAHGSPNGGPDGGPDGTRWQGVTVVGGPDDVAPGGRLPEPLAALGDRVETRVRPAPGGKGTEIAARLRTPVPTGISGALARAANKDPRQDVRSALRRSKQLVEVGEVLAVDPAPHGRRGAVGTALIGAASKRAGREGVL